MDTFLNPKGAKALDLEIERLTIQLGCMSPVDQDYAKIVDNIKVLSEAKSKYDKATVSPDMVLGIAANIIGLLVILNFERTGSITSKAISFLWKVK